MANQKAVDDALARAVESATVDLDADPAEQVAFDPPALARVRDLYRAPGGADLVVRAWHRALRRALTSERIETDRRVCNGNRWRWWCCATGYAELVT